MSGSLTNYGETHVLDALFSVEVRPAAVSGVEVRPGADSEVTAK